VLAWPAGIKARGEIRHQYAHVTDMVPTVLDVIGIDAPAKVRGVPQSPIEGVSFAHTFDDAEAPTHHTTQYFEMFGHRSLYHDGWRAVCPWPGPSYTDAAQAGHKVGDAITPAILEELDREGWELYDVTADPAETHNVAADHPDRLRDMVATWWAEAEKYKVLPLDGSLQIRLAAERPQTSRPRTSFTYYPNGSVVPAFACPPAFNRPYSIVADVELATDGASGVLVAQGGDAGGFTFHFKDGRPRFVYNFMGRDEYVVEGKDPVAPGRHELRYEFEPTGDPDIPNGKGSPGRGQLYVDGDLVGNTEYPVTAPLIFELEGLSCGYDFGAPASDEYEPPFAFTDTIHSVTFDLAGELIIDDAAQVALLMAQQ
jgi:hypothetical protein